MNSDKSFRYAVIDNKHATLLQSSLCNDRLIHAKSKQHMQKNSWLPTSVGPLTAS